MGTRGLKICKACKHSFEPQLTDSEIREIWFTEEELAADDEHKLFAGHGHLQAPVQDLCAKCSIDPNVEVMHGGLFGGAPQYRIKRDDEDRPRRLKVSDGNIIAPPRHENTHKVKTSDGLEMTIQGPLPPQEVIDAMGEAMRASRTEGTIKPSKRPKITITRKEKKPTLWQRFFGKKKP